ncbi:MAG: hypothetical protein MR543_08640 [Robinsoniella sp.]|nr:hypothetical protein [Robinsoniella sp.]
MTTDEKLDLLLRQFGEFREDVKGVKTEVTGLKTEVEGIKTEVTGLKTEVEGIKTEVTDLKTETKRNYDMLEKFYVEQKEWNTELREDLEVTMDQVSLNSRKIANNTAKLRKLAQ